MIEKLEYYIAYTHNPHYNLAVEKYLLDTVQSDTCILYLWQNENTVVIGKNQNAWAECRIRELEESGGHLARRLSGGGAVFHDLGNLNFTFLYTKENADINRNLQILQAACRLAGIETEFSGRNDLLADGKKFSGNAFYNSGGKAYHHGTLLVDADLEKMGRFLTPAKAKLEAKGVASVRARVTNLKALSPDLTIEKMQAYVLSAFETFYNLKATPIEISSTDEIDTLAQTYQSAEYLLGKTLPFSATAEAHFAWGHAELLLNIEKGIIRSVQLFTDAMDENLSERIAAALTDCPLTAQATHAALSVALPNPQSDDIFNLLKQIL